jgi:hypothetical protein
MIGERERRERFRRQRHHQASAIILQGRKDCKPFFIFENFFSLLNDKNR